MKKLVLVCFLFVPAYYFGIKGSNNYEKYHTGSKNKVINEKLKTNKSNIVQIVTNTPTSIITKANHNKISKTSNEFLPKIISLLKQNKDKLLPVLEKFKDSDFDLGKSKDELNEFLKIFTSVLEEAGIYKDVAKEFGKYLSKNSPLSQNKFSKDEFVEFGKLYDTIPELYHFTIDALESQIEEESTSPILLQNSAKLILYTFKERPDWPSELPRMIPFLEKIQDSDNTDLNSLIYATGMIGGLYVDLAMKEFENTGNSFESKSFAFQSLNYFEQLNELHENNSNTSWDKYDYYKSEAYLYGGDDEKLQGYINNKYKNFDTLELWDKQDVLAKDGLLAIRNDDYDKSFENIEKILELMPNDPSFNENSKYLFPHKSWILIYQLSGTDKKQDITKLLNDTLKSKPELRPSIDWMKKYLSTGKSLLNAGHVPHDFFND